MRAIFGIEMRVVGFLSRERNPTHENGFAVTGLFRLLTTIGSLVIDPRCFHHSLPLAGPLPATNPSSKIRSAHTISERLQILNGKRSFAISY